MRLRIERSSMFFLEVHYLLAAAGLSSCHYSLDNYFSSSFIHFPSSREHPSEPHYLYALGRLEAQKWVPEGDENHHRISRSLMERQQDADVKLRANLDAREKPPAFYGDKVMAGESFCFSFVCLYLFAADVLYF